MKISTKLMRAGGFCVALGSLSLAGCAQPPISVPEHRVAGRSPAEDFFDPRVAALVTAACKGDGPAMRSALAGGADPNYSGFEGVTPLLWVLDCENLDGLNQILQAGADPNLKVPSGFSATYAAATRRNPALLPVLLAAGGDPNTYFKDDVRRSALFEALELGWGGHGWGNYYALLDAGADINRADSLGNTIATYAVTLGAFDKAQELLDRGYNHDLNRLARFVGSRTVDAEAFPEMALARSRLVASLEARGVAVPSQ